MRILSLVSEGNGLVKRIRSYVWVFEQRLVDQANTIRRNSWMTQLEIEKLERNLAENDSCKEEESADDTGNNLGEEVRHILTAMEAMRKLAIVRKKRFLLLKK